MLARSWLDPVNVLRLPEEGASVKPTRSSATSVEPGSLKLISMSTITNATRWPGSVTDELKVIVAGPTAGQSGVLKPRLIGAAVVLSATTALGSVTDEAGTCHRTLESNTGTSGC